MRKASKKYLLPLALVALFAAVLSACGGDDSDGGGDGPTKAEYVKEVDAICADANDELLASTEEVSPNAGQAEIEAFVTDTYVPLLDQEVADLRAVTPPEGDEDETAAIYDALAQGIRTIEEDPSLMTTENAENPLQEASDLANEYGLKVCGQAGS